MQAKQARATVSEGDRTAFSNFRVIAKHNLHQLPYFDDDSLISILDACPRNRLRVWMSAKDSSSFEHWNPVDTTGIDGKGMIECLNRGRLWFNLQRIDLVDPHFAEMSRSLYEDLSRDCDRFKVDFVHAYLLISSPNASVHLHLDSYENFFWCIRGEKRFYLYPPYDPRMVSTEFMEDVCSGADDFFPYKKEFAALATMYRLAPGDMMSWPQHSPHHTANNAELSVGLGTFHGTKEGTRRVLNFVANRYFREHFPSFHDDVRHGSLATAAKRLSFQAIRKIFPMPELKKTEFWTCFKLDPEAPTGVVRIGDEAVLAECSRVA